MPELRIRQLCPHNFEHYNYMSESRIIVAFLGDYNALTARKFADCVQFHLLDQVTLIEQSVILIIQYNKGSWRLGIFFPKISPKTSLILLGDI